MHHRHLLDDLFGVEFIDSELIPRITATTKNTTEQAMTKLDNCLAYLQARGSMPDPNSPLVCNLGPDEAWHVFILFTYEYSKFCEFYFGVYLHHDPAEEAALVNSPTNTETTLAVFSQCGIRYDADLWRDHLLYPMGAMVVPSIIVPRDFDRW